MSSLGVDHTALLGETVAEIAWHKAGIIKPGEIFFLKKKSFVKRTHGEKVWAGGIGKTFSFFFAGVCFV